jgi:ribosome-binding factor A
MSKRTDMLGSAIRTIVAPVIRECPPACGIVSITRVEVSGDFSYATLYITALREPKQAMNFLITQLPDLQRKLSALERQRIPHLRFRQDVQAEEGNRIDQLLAEASKWQPEESSQSAQE